MDGDSREKVGRVLSIYTKLINGGLVNKAEEAARYNVAERSIQRDIDDIRAYLGDVEENDGVLNDVIYDRAKKAFRLERIYDIKLTNPEILALCKILLDSRTLTKVEMDSILKRLVQNCVPYDDCKHIKDLIQNEQFHYIQPKHGKVFIPTMWEIGHAIEEKRVIEFDYQGVRSVKPHHRVVEPVAIMNAGMYFYMIGFIINIDREAIFDDSDGLSPTIYRIDKLLNIKVTKEHFNLPYKDRFEEGEFRKRVQFMFPGKLRKVRFKYRGYSMEAVEDRLPTAKVVKVIREEVRGREQDVYIVEAEVYGDGIAQWFRQQGEMVEEIVK